MRHSMNNASWRTCTIWYQHINSTTYTKNTPCVHHALHVCHMLTGNDTWNCGILKPCSVTGFYFESFWFTLHLPHLCRFTCLTCHIFMCYTWNYTLRISFPVDCIHAFLTCVFSLHLSPSHDVTHGIVRKPGGGRGNDTSLHINWREAESACYNGGGWSQLSVSFNSCREFWWSLSHVLVSS